MAVNILKLLVRTLTKRVGWRVFSHKNKSDKLLYLFVLDPKVSNMTGMLQFEDALLAARFAANHPWVNPVDPDAERKAFAEHLFNFMKKRK